MSIMSWVAENREIIGSLASGLMIVSGIWFIVWDMQNKEVKTHVFMPPPKWWLYGSVAGLTLSVLTFALLVYARHF